MTEQYSFSIEEKLHDATRMPQPRPEFLAGLRTHLTEETPRSPSWIERIGQALRQPAWAAALIALLLAASFLIAGPQRVMAAVRGLFGYIPGVGIVDQSSPLRVLVEPVSVERDGISVTVTSAILSADRTVIETRIFGVPGSAYPDREDTMGCTQRPYLRLPDGTQLTQLNDFPPVPADIDAAVLVMPCIFGTLPGSVPENWELTLRFVPAPPELTVMPVTELSPAPEADSTAGTASDVPSAAENDPVVVDQVVETSDGYILIGRLRMEEPPGETMQLASAPEIQDASGKIVVTSYPLDVNVEAGNPNGSETSWAVQFKAAGLVYPLTITFRGEKIHLAEPGATAEFAFDTGPNPLPGQEWTYNQDLQLAGRTLRLVSIRSGSRNGYNFIFQGDPDVIRADIEILGHIAAGWGRGYGAKEGEFATSLSFAQIPSGVLTVRLSNLIVRGDAITWQGQWSPATPRTDLPDHPVQQPGVCLTPDTSTQLEQVPSDLSSGKALIYEQLDDMGEWGLVLYSLDGSGKQVVVPKGNWGSLSPDGSRVAYSATDSAIHIVNVATQTEQILEGVSGFNIHWSPDGKQIAYIGMGGGTINSAFVANVDGTQVRQVSKWSYETIIGWSPDGSQLYFAAPFTDGAAWKIYALNLASGTAQERFTIENGTAKFLDPSLSPDGNWIAYRGRDNSSVYLVRTDGSDTRLVIDNANAVGIEWSRSGWLGASLRPAMSTESTVVMFRPDGCQGYLLPGLKGNLEGLSVP